jgi:hypothetical protein
MHCEHQTHETEIMVAVQMTNKNITGAMKVCLVFHQLHLCAFSAVDHEMSVLNFNNLARWKSPKGWKRATRTKYGNLETHYLPSNTQKTNDQNRKALVIV